MFPSRPKIVWPRVVRKPSACRYDVLAIDSGFPTRKVIDPPIPNPHFVSGVCITIGRMTNLEPFRNDVVSCATGWVAAGWQIAIPGIKMRIAEYRPTFISLGISDSYFMH